MGWREQALLCVNRIRSLGNLELLLIKTTGSRIAPYVILLRKSTNQLENLGKDFLVTNDAMEGVGNKFIMTTIVAIKY